MAEVADVAVASPAKAGGRGSGLIRSSLLSMLAIAALGVTRLVHNVLVARSTDKATLAGVGVLIGSTMIAGLFLPGGVSSAVGKFVPYHLGRSDTAAAVAVYRMLTLVGYLGSLILGAGVGAWALWWGFATVDAVSVGVLTVVFSIYSVEKAALYGFDRVNAYARLELAGAAITIVATIVVVVAGWTTYLVPLTIGYAVLILGAWVLLRRSAPSDPDSRKVRFPREHLREIAGYVGLASLGGMASMGLLQALPVIADSYTTREQAAYFVTAVGLVTPLFFLPRALGMALFPAMAHAHGAGDTDAVRRHADLTTRALFGLLAPLFVIAILLSRTILMFIYGADYAPGAVVLQILLMGSFLMMTHIPAVNALSSGSRREVRIPVFSAVTGCAIGVLAAIPLSMALGGPGLALGYLLAAILSATGPLVGVARRHNLASWVGPIGRAVGVMGAGLVLAVLVERIPVDPDLRWLLDSGAALGLGAVAALVLYRDIRSIVRYRKGSV